jgi:tetratricopeptide (TPR) repeat protein
MYKISLFFLACVLYGSICFSRSDTVDSLQTLLKTVKEDSSRVNVLNDLSWELITVGDYAKATEHANEAIQLSEKLNWKKGLALSLNTIGIIYWYQGDYPKALDYEYRVLKLGEETGDKKRIAGSLNNIGSIYHEQGDLDKALEDQHKALKIYEGINAKPDIANLFNNIGVIYRKKHDYVTAIDYHNKALKIREEIGDKTAIASSLNNIGVLQYEQNNYSLALEYYSKALKIFEELGDKKNITNLLINIGNNYFKQKKYEEALRYQNQSLIPAMEIGYLEGVKEAEKSLSEIYQQLNDNALALLHYKKYVDVRDSVFNETKSRQIAEMRTKYELNQKEKEIALLTNEKKLNEIELYSAIIGLLLISIIVFVLYNRHHVKQKLLAEKQKLVIEKQLIEIEQRALLLQMNPHFIFNSLSSIGSLIYENKPQIAVKYLTKFSRLMRLILEYSLEPAIPLSREIELLNCYIELEQFRFEDKFDFTLIIDPQTPTETNIPPMLIQPHVENAILHGLNSKSEKGHLKIKIGYTNNTIVFDVEDDGIGREKAKRQAAESTHKSMATNITQKRLELINQEGKAPIQLTIKDLKSVSGEAIGTLVKIVIPV